MPRAALYLVDRGCGGVRRRRGRDEGALEGFEPFVRAAEPRLARALTSTYGPMVGREATLDALSWAWEHWDQVAGMANPVGYLYRVGQTAARRQLSGVDVGLPAPVAVPFDGMEPGLLPALRTLSDQQRAAVLLVHGYAWTLKETADLLGCSVSTVRNHLDRALRRLRTCLEVEHVHD